MTESFSETWVLIYVCRGVNEWVKVFDTEDEAKAYVPPVSAWQSYGYKQGGPADEYRHYELFLA